MARSWRKSIWYATGGVLVLLAVGFLIACAERWTAPEEGSTADTVAREWNTTISQLGLEPIYPPQEDIVVGDIFLIITDDLRTERVSESLAGRSLKIWHADLTKELKQAYQQTYSFPRIPQESKDGAPANSSAMQGSIFDAPPERQDLPLVVLPGFTAARVREVSASGGWLKSVLGAVGAFEARGEKTIELKIPEAETYGVGALVANGHLQSFCSDDKFKPVCAEPAARRLISSIVGEKAFEQVSVDGKMTYRLTLEILLVSRVYLAREIESVVHTGSGVGAQARVATQLKETIERLEKRAASIGEEGDGKPAADGLAAWRRELAEQRALLQKSISQATGTPSGGDVVIQSANDNRISVAQKLRRPVAIAYRAIRMTLSEN